MSKVTENNIINCLTDFTHPGGPFFPSRPLRHLSSKVMNEVFPNRPAKKPRKLVHSFFRLLHPYYWAESISFYALDYSKRSLIYLKEQTVDRVVSKLLE